MKNNDKKKEKKLNKQILEIVFCVLFCLLFLLIITSAISLVKGKQPDIFGYSFLHVATGSMEPAIPEKSLILVKNIDETEVEKMVKKDDVIVYFSKKLGVTITHRVVDIDYENKTITTRGDANKKDDETIHFSDVCSVFVKRLAFFTVVVNLLTSPVGFVVCILLPLSVLIVLYVINIIKNSTKLALEKANQDKLDYEKKLVEEAIREYNEKLKTDTQSSTCETDALDEPSKDDFKTE